MKETSNRNTSKNGAVKGGAAKGSAAKGSASNSSVSKSSAVKGSASNSTVSKGSAVKGSASNSTVSKSGAVKGNASNSSVSKSGATKGSVSKGGVPKTSVPKTSVPKTSAPKSSMSKSSAPKSSTAKSAAPNKGGTAVKDPSGPPSKGAGDLLKRAGGCAGRWLKENFCVKGPEAGRIALNGLIFHNPTFVLLLGMCPTLAVTTSLLNGLGMGLSATAVLVCSNLVISLLRKVIPSQIRIASYIVIIATFVTAVDLLLQAFVPSLSAALGLYIPLIVVNCIILGRAEAFASRRTPGASLLDGLFMGLGFTAALAILGAIREVLGAGTIWGVAVPGLSKYPVGLILSPCGGFITLGILVALVQWLRGRPRKGGGQA